MRPFEIVAHRGVPTEAPENTIPAFLKAVELGADAVELDVRLTKDRVPVVYHYYYLDEITHLRGPIFNYSFEQLRSAKLTGMLDDSQDAIRISTLRQVLEALGGQIGFEIEIKGPERESTKRIGTILNDYRSLWEQIEVTSYEPQLLRDIQRECPGLIADLLFPRSEDWMKLDVVAYSALHRARLADARAVHLHPTQLSDEVVNLVREGGIEVHAWDVNDRVAFQRIIDYQIPKFSTDRLAEILGFSAETGRHKRS